MKTSEKGLEIIKRFEGLELKSYLCPANVWTVGYGHTKTAKEGMDITESKAEELLREDIRMFEEGVQKAVEVKLDQEQFDALVSFTFNVGLGAFRASTLRRKLNKSDYKGAANEFKKWKFANGRILSGLVRRRKAEADLFTTNLGRSWEL